MNGTFKPQLWFSNFSSSLGSKKYSLKTTGPQSITNRIFTAWFQPLNSSLPIYLVSYLTFRKAHCPCYSFAQNVLPAYLCWFSASRHSPNIFACSDWQNSFSSLLEYLVHAFIIALTTKYQLFPCFTSYSVNLSLVICKICIPPKKEYLLYSYKL